MFSNFLDWPPTTFHKWKVYGVHYTNTRNTCMCDHIMLERKVSSVDFRRKYTSFHFKYLDLLRHRNKVWSNKITVFDYFRSYLRCQWKSLELQGGILSLVSTQLTFWSLILLYLDHTTSHYYNKRILNVIFHKRSFPLFYKTG